MLLVHWRREREAGIPALASPEWHELRAAGVGSDAAEGLQFVKASSELQPGRVRQIESFLSGMISGLDVQYAMPGADASALIGRRMLDLDLDSPAGQTRVSQLLHAGCGLLLDLSTHDDLAAVAARWSAQVDYIQASTPADFAASAVLVRPDGYICWTAENASPDVESALRNWFGPC
jgi:hypothetical protein